MKSNQSYGLFITFLLAAIFVILSVIPNIVEAQNRQLTKPANSDKDETKRVALVIGNGDYTNARKLSNPVNDATDMAKTLKELDFEVISGTNLSLKQMTDVQLAGQSNELNLKIGRNEAYAIVNGEKSEVYVFKIFE